MNSDKIYTGEEFSFFRQKEHLGRGGNGAVYDVTLTSSKTQEINYPLVAKFFEYEGVNKDKRYSRFKNEVRVLKKHEDLCGIIKVLDNYCPEQVPKNKDVAWHIKNLQNDIFIIYHLRGLVWTLHKIWDSLTTL